MTTETPGRGYLFGDALSVQPPTGIVAVGHHDDVSASAAQTSV